MRISDDEKKELITAFNKVKCEFSDHLEAINGNTNEIQADYEHLCKIESKVNKLNERIDELTMRFSQIIGFSPDLERTDYEPIDLTRREMDVFIVLKKLKEGQFTTYEEISAKLNQTPQIIIEYIGNLIAKGIPIIKRYVANSAKVAVDPQFLRNGKVITKQIRLNHTR